MKTATISVKAASYDTQNGLRIKIYANEEMRQKDQFAFFGVDNEEELDKEIDLMNKGESFICNYDDEDGRFNLLSVVDVPDNMNKSYVLFDVYEVIDGFETVITQLSEVETFCPKSEALENSRYYKNDIDGHYNALRYGDWDEKSRTLKDSNNLIIIKNIRNITPQQAVIFRLAKSF